MTQFNKTLCALMLSILMVTTASAGEIWKITSLDWQPYSDSKSPTQGNSIQKLRTLLKKADIDLIVEFYPWARAQEIAKQNGYVGYFPAWPEEVGEGFIASPAVDWSEVGVMTYIGSGLEWTSLEKLFKSKVGLVSSYEYPEEIDKLAFSRPRNVDPTPNEMALLKKLSAARIDAAITDPTVMFYLAEEVGIDNIKVLKVLRKSALVVAFRNDAKNLEKMKVLEGLLEE